MSKAFVTRCSIMTNAHDDSTYFEVCEFYENTKI